MTESDKERLSTLKYVVENENGYLEDLKEAIGQERVDEFCSLGFIHVGCIWDAETWGVTELCRRYYDIVK